MSRGGARPGSGPKKSIAKLQEKLTRIQDEMQKGFYEAAYELARNQPALVREAIKYALAGDKGLLKFLIEQFNRMVGALPQEEQSVYKLYHERLLLAVERSFSPPVGSDSARNVIDVERVPDAEDDGTILRPEPNQADNGGGAGGEVLSRSIAVCSPPHAG